MNTNEEYIRKNKVITVDDDKNTKLHYAAALDNYEEVKKHIATGQKIDPENYLGWTPLMMAIRNANMAIVTLLLDHKADATKTNKFGISVFLLSVACGDLDVVEKILNHLLCGGISRQSLQRVFSPISLAILFGQPRTFQYLIERSFDINTPTLLTGITPSMFAAAMGNYKAYKKLTQHKADMNLKNCLGKTAPEILAARNQRVDIGNFDKKPKSPNIPIIIVSPHTGPQLQLTPYPSNALPTLRKSSNTRTPNIIATPNMTPITPQFFPQIFFPPSFSPGQFISPTIGYHSYQSNEFLNANINQSAYFSPSPQQMCHPSYV